MKLSIKQVRAIKKQTGLKALPDEAAAEAGLPDTFGDQTFYVDADGLYVFEPVEQPSGEGEPVLAIRLARVERDPEGGDEVTLRPVPPQTTNLTVDLAA